MYIFVYKFVIFLNRLVLEQSFAQFYDMAEVNIGDKIKSVILKKGISISEFGRRIDMSRVNIYSIFHRKSIDTALLAKIGKVLEHDFFSYYHSTETRGNVVENTQSYSYVTKEDLNLLKKEVELLAKSLSSLEKKVGKGKKSS